MPTYKNISNVNQSYEDIKGNHKIAAPNETITTFQLLDWLYGSDKWQKISDEPRYYPLLGFDYHYFASDPEEWSSNVPKKTKIIIVSLSVSAIRIKFNNAPNYKAKEGAFDIIYPPRTLYMTSQPYIFLADGKIQTLNFNKFASGVTGEVYIYYMDKTELNGFLPYGIIAQNFQLIDIGEK